MKRQLSVLGCCAAIMVLFSCYAEAAPSRTPTSIKGHFDNEWTMEVALQPNGVADGYIQVDTYRYPYMTPVTIIWDVYAWSTDGSSITLYAFGFISDSGLGIESVFVFSTSKSKEFLWDGSVYAIMKGGYSIGYSR